MFDPLIKRPHHSYTVFKIKSDFSFLVSSRKKVVTLSLPWKENKKVGMITCHRVFPNYCQAFICVFILTDYFYTPKFHVSFGIYRISYIFWSKCSPRLCTPCPRSTLK